MRRPADGSPLPLVFPLLVAGVLVPAPAVHAQEAEPSEREQEMLELVKDRDPEVRVDDVDMERLRVRRIPGPPRR